METEMEFGTLKRIYVCIFVLLLAVLLTRNSSAGETFFCSVIGVVGAAGFLLVKPRVSLAERLRMIGIWDLMMPVALAVYMAVIKMSDLESNVVRFVFMGIFVVGFGTAVKLIFHHRKK